jgi:hypothetical protein
MRAGRKFAAVPSSFVPDRFDLFDEQLATHLAKTIVSNTVLPVASPSRFSGRAVMKRCLMTMCSAALAVVATLAQQEKDCAACAHSPRTRPTLEVTMNFIQDMLNGQGAVDYISTYEEGAGWDQIG